MITYDCIIIITVLWKYLNSTFLYTEQSTSVYLQ